MKHNQSPPKTNATIKDVARAAGVSVSTVSRVINGNYPVREVLRERVNAAIEELNFRPHMAASSLRSGRTYNIGILLSRLDNVSMMQMSRGIETVVEKEHYTLTISSTSNNPEREKQQISTLAGRTVDAIIVATSLRDPVELEGLCENTPLILIDRRLPGAKYDTVVENNYDASLTLTRYILKRGHRRIAFLKGIAGMQMAEDRYNGFRDALNEGQIPFCPELELECRFRKDESRAKVGLMLDTLPREQWPTLIYAANIPSAEGAMDAIHQRRLRIPEDISLVVYGDMELPSLFTPAITCVRQRSYDMGVQAGELVLQRLHELYNGAEAVVPHPAYILLKSPLFEGESVKDLSKNYIGSGSR